MISYKIYGNNRKFGWELLNTVYLEEKVHEFISSYINASDYESVMVIKHIEELNEDIPYMLEFLDIPMRRVRK